MMQFDAHDQVQGKLTVQMTAKFNFDYFMRSHLPRQCSVFVKLISILSIQKRSEFYLKMRYTNIKYRMQ